MAATRESWWTRVLLDGWRPPGQFNASRAYEPWYYAHDFWNDISDPVRLLLTELQFTIGAVAPLLELTAYDSPKLPSL